MRSAVPAASGDSPTKKEGERTQDEHTNAHRNTEAEYMRAKVTHGDKFKVEILEKLGGRTSREESIAREGDKSA